MKYILINKSEASTRLKGYADSEIEMIVLRIPVDNVTSAETELASIDNDYWVSSDSFEEVEGETTDSILLPKEAINA